MHYAIVEDLETDQRHLMELIRKISEENGEQADFSCFPSGELFLASFHRGLYSAVFLDIALGSGHMSGIEAAEKMRSAHDRTPVIFTTTESGFALDSYKVHALDYLIKPVREQDLSWCLKELQNRLPSPSLIEIQESSGQGISASRAIVLDDLLYAETVRHGLIIHTVRDEIHTRLTFSELVNLLPKSGRFYVSGRGLLLNFSQVKTIRNTGEVFLKDGRTIFSPKRRIKETQTAFSSYIFDSLRQRNEGGHSL